MKKILWSSEKKRRIPNLKEFVYIIRNFSFKEKIIFLGLAVVFTISSLVLFWKINNAYLTETPIPGDSIVEGIIGTPRFINPVLALSDADRDMASLVYSGLLRPDNQGGLIPDLAEKFEISEDGLIYTFTLKDNLVWHDGEKITSDDIIFTIQQTKDPSVKSPKRANWEGVEVEKINDRVVAFYLKKPYTPFLENACMGILPSHIWKEATSEQMGFSEFNTNPIGSGPYKINKIEKNSSGIATSYELASNDKFVLGEPYIKTVIARFYPSEKDMLTAYQKGDIDSINAINPEVATNIKKIDSAIKTSSLPRVFGIFFNQNSSKVLAKTEVRQALNLATDKETIIKNVLQGFGIKLEYPIPPGTFGALSSSDENIFSIEKAQETLKSNGWNFNEEERVWEKSEKVSGKTETLKLEFSIATSDSPDLKKTAEIIKTDWEKMGAKVAVKIYEIGDLNQNVIRPRKYDALLFGEILGRDPDPFAFWHSSQRNDPGLNIALYTNIKVDKLLEQARALFDESQRKAKYEEFQKEVIKDNPAIFLFSPKFIYIMPSKIKGTDIIKSISVPSERFAQIHKWYIKTDKIWKIFAREEI